MNLRGSGGQYLCKPLFWETSTPASRERFQPLYTLKEHDHVDEEGNVYRSIYEVFMSCDSEYDAAIQLVGSLYHWDKLCECKWFVEGYLGYMGLEAWREHKNRELESKALKQLMAQADDGNMQAQKYLHQHKLDAGAVKSNRKKTGPKPHNTKNTAESELEENIANFANRKRG